jgi:hypothetical protein
MIGFSHSQHGNMKEWVDAKSRTLEVEDVHLTAQGN